MQNSLSGVATLLEWAVLAAAAAGLAYWSIAAAFGWLSRHVVAVPNARSSHGAPRPQGGGIVVIAVTIVAAGIALAFYGDASNAAGATNPIYAPAVAAASMVLAVVGLIDDSRGLSIGPRLATQILAVAGAVFLLPAELRVLPAVIPATAERILLILAGLWFVNLFNFMDGIDWIAGTETIGIALGIAALAGLGVVPLTYGYVAAALLGATLGFMPWNAPPARLFLGDAGSIPIGFLVAVLLLHVALAGPWVAALILPLYYVADATLTLAQRAWRREAVWRAHRDHFYQQATRNGFTVRQTVGRIAIVNTALVVLAIVSTFPGQWWAPASLLAAVGVVGITLLVFAKGHS
jgi:UDP-N-acetylmuramyl pentapeptide phosphotransferase/UDP-N-acetylglucosamine-1-phosphate transferase